MNPESETNRIKGLLTSALYFDEYMRHSTLSAPQKALRKKPKSKKTLANRAKNKQAKQNRKRNRK